MAHRFSEAVEQFEQVIKLDPNNVGARNNLANALSQSHQQTASPAQSSGK